MMFIVSDPLSAGNINQCDFFTIQSNSPAAKLDFKNLTKLPKWTPGCEIEESVVDYQFYYW